MKPRLFAASFVALVTLAVPTLTASAQTVPPIRDDWAVASYRGAQLVRLSPPIRDDWARASYRGAQPVHASPPIHDDWAVESSSFALNLQLSLQGE